MKRIIVCAIAFLLFCAVSLGIHSRADFGDYAGDYDYGGYDGGYDYDDDYDYGGDYGGTYYGGTYSSGSGSSDGFIIVIIVIIMIIVIISRVRRSPKGSSGNGTYSSPRVNTNMSSAAKDSYRSLSEYREIDPGFDEHALCERMSNLYMQLQTCWTAKDIEPLRPYLTDSLYNMSERQLDNLRKSGRTNYVERIAVLACNALGFTQDGGNDFMYLSLRTRIVDYTVDESGNVVSGSKTAEKFLEYRWTLMRKSGIVTAETSGVRTVSCPHCGAPVDINATAKCEYCGSVITVDNEDWVISAIEGVSQTTRG